MYANVRGLVSKKPSLKNVLEIKKPDVIIFTETHLIGKTTTTIEGYDQIITRNRKDKGGGLLLAVKKNTDIEAMILNIDDNHEIMWVKLKFKNQNYIIAIVYGYSGESRVEEDEIDEWYYSLEKEISKYTEEKVIIVGDLNAHIGNDEDGIEGNIEKINQNGKLLRSLVERRCLFVINATEKCIGKWTREDPNGGRSIIDYVIANENSVDNIENMQIDDEHEFKISRFLKTRKGSQEKPSDHNTIFFELQGHKSKKMNIIKRWNFKNEDSMKNYFNETNNLIMKETWTEKENINVKYKRWSKQIKTIMYKTLHRVTIKEKISNDVIKKDMNQKRKINKEIKRLQNKPKLKRVIEALKKKNIQIVDNINNQIELEKAERLKGRLKRYMKDPSMKRNDIWTMRKQCLRKKDQKMTVKNKEGKILSTKDDIHKEYVSHFQQVLKNRKIKPDYIKYENEINKQIEINKNIKTYDNDTINGPITQQEVRKVIKSLKAGKAPGQDEIGNELFINAGNDLITNLVNMFNYFWTNEEIPTELMKITIKTIYKGKGETCNLDNQRGLFLSSCILKFYEKIILNRITPPIEEKTFTEFQGGGRSNRSTRDQLFILRSLIDFKTFKKEKLYLQFMDLSKAFDKMVLKNIMVNLWNAKIRGRIWRTILKINEYAQLTVSTPFGTTKEFTANEILKQGSVLASTLAAMHIDDINKYFVNENLGTYYGEIKIENLLFQDDIVRFEDSEEGLNKANVILEIFENINKMEFHPLKTKVLKINTKSEKEIKLGINKIGYVNEIKYLGDLISNDGKIDEMLKERKNSINGITAELVTILAQINVETEIPAILQYIHGIIIPKLLVNSETWSNITMKNIETLEGILNKSLKRILKIPYSTPNMGLINELGILSIKNEITKRKINFLHSIINGKNKILKEILNQQTQLPGPTWIYDLKNTMNEMNIPTSFHEIEQISKYKMKKLIKNKIWKKQQNELQTYIENSHKCLKLKTNIVQPKKYLIELSPKHAKTILLARLRMIDIKTNFKNKYNDLKCSFCSDNDETLDHLIVCKKLPENCKILKMFTVDTIYDDLYGDNMETLKLLAEGIEELLDEMEDLKLNTDESVMIPKNPPKSFPLPNQICENPESETFKSCVSARDPVQLEKQWITPK